MVPVDYPELSPMPNPTAAPIGMIAALGRKWPQQCLAAPMTGSNSNQRANAWERVREFVRQRFCRRSPSSLANPSLQLVHAFPGPHFLQPFGRAVTNRCRFHPAVIAGGGLRPNVREAQFLAARFGQVRSGSGRPAGICSCSNAHSRTVGSCSEVGRFSWMIAKSTGGTTRVA